MPLHSSSRTTHKGCFGSGAETKFRRLARFGISAAGLPFLLFPMPVTVKLKKKCQAGSAARLKPK
jgi:hypothetical protein